MDPLKDRVIKNIPDRLFKAVANVYYGVLPNKENLRIDRVNGSWSIQRDGIKLLSPTPKFLGFGFRVFESKFEQHLKIEKGDTVLDVGACIGDTTIPMITKAGTKGLVVAVEPHPTNIKFLKRNVSDFPNVEIVEKAVWNTSGVIKFNVHDTPTGHTIVGKRGGQIEVQCDTLDNIVDDRIVDFTKIDVQGAEVQVLEGALRFLETARKVIVETHDRYSPELRTYPEVLRILRENNYETRLTPDGIVHSKKLY